MTTAPPHRTAPGARDRMRSVPGRFATWMTVLTAGRAEPRGMTADSFTSVSRNPPLVLVCAARTAALHDTALAEGGFAVSVLAADQDRVARHFADHRRPREGTEFDTVETFRGRHTGAPLLAGAPAWLE
jgi:flavin reductase (DIM6/NTAB) family NADH-FMN oxidoreductase RutF